MIVFGIIISIISAWFCSRFSPAAHQKLLIALSIFFTGSEIGKQILLYNWNHHSYIWWYFPFQLCSMPLYLLPAALMLRNSSCSRLRQALFTFLADFGTLSGIFVFADTTGMHYQLPILTVHSYLWHFLMIFTGILLGLSPEFANSAALDTSSDLPETTANNLHKPLYGLKPRFFDACMVFLSGAGIATIINTLFHHYSSINMFYISPWEPVTQAVFRDIAGITGNNICHIIYLTVIVAGAGIVHVCFFD